MELIFHIECWRESVLHKPLSLQLLFLRAVSELLKSYIKYAGTRTTANRQTYINTNINTYTHAKRRYIKYIDAFIVDYIVRVIYLDVM